MIACDSNRFNGGLVVFDDRSLVLPRLLRGHCHLGRVWTTVYFGRFTSSAKPKGYDVCSLSLKDNGGF